MANTFSQMYVHVVFAVQHRAALIDVSWEEHLYKYITGIVQHKGQKMLAINGMPDHIHLLIGVKPDCRLSDLVREIKKSSHDFINDSHFLKVKFNWQTGFGAFTYGQSQIDGVIHYVMNQKSHHSKTTFREEYLNLLRKFGVEFNEKYLFEWI